MADVQELRVIKATLRCPECASPNIRRDAKIEGSGIFQLTERCGKCKWRNEPVYVRV